MPTAPSPPPDWTASEPGLSAAIRAVLRLLGKAAHRPILVVFVALALSATTVAATRRPRVHTAVVTLKLAESSVERGRQTTPRNLKTHLLQAALSSQRLAAIVGAHHLYPEVATADPASAVALLRSRFTLEVSQNGLSAERSEDDPARSARIEIAFSALDAAVATAVATSLADALMEAEGERRADDAAAAAAAVANGLDALRERYFTVVEARRSSARGDGSGRPSSRTRALLREEAGLKLRLTDMETQRTSLELLTRAELQGLGTQLTRVGEHVSSRGGTTSAALFALGAVLFVLALPIVALLVGAFDSRVRDREDLERAGARVLVDLPRRPGGSRRARIGSMSTR